MKNKLTSFILALCLLIAIPLSARYKYNPFTRKLDYYEPVSGSDLGDLGDVTLTGLAAGNVLYYNGTAWVNLPLVDPASIFYISATGGDYTSIQTALNEENSGGETFLVGPGTYTDTISFTANDQVVKPLGHTANVIVTQADANIVDAGAFTDCIIEDIEFRLTAPTTAINAIQVGTGTLILIECRGYLATAVALAQVNQPSIVGFTDAGTIRIKRGNYQYYHTGNTGETGVKAAFRANVNLAELHLHKIDVAVVTNSGTALVTSFFLTTGTAVVEMHNVVDCIVTDPNATNVIGMGYLAGGGIHNLQGNHIDVVATDNTSYGLYHGGTSTIRSAFNAIHASDEAGSSYAFYVGTEATLNSHFDDLRSVDGNSIAGTFVQVSSPADGDLAITDELNVTGSFTNTMDATTEVMNIIQSNAAGTANTPLIFIDDTRTGGTANVKEEATIRIDAEGMYSFYFEDGWQYFGDRSVWGPDVPLYIGEATDQFVAMWDSNGAADGLMLMGGGNATNDSSALMFIKGGTVDGMTDHDDYKSTTFVVVNRQGADGDDYSAVVMGERTQTDVTIAHYFDFYAMTGALDGEVDGSNTELGATFRFGPNGTGVPDNATTPGDVLFEGSIEIDGEAYLDGGQLKFPAAQSASADVNTLDDYEEGTFTPYIYDASSGGNQGGSGNGYYTKIGNLVYVRVNFSNVSTVGLTGANEVFIRPLPFTVNTNGSAFGALWARYITINFSYLIAQAVGNSVYCTLVDVQSGGNGANVIVSDVANGTADFGFTLTYRVQ